MALNDGALGGAMGGRGGKKPNGRPNRPNRPNNPNNNGGGGGGGGGGPKLEGEWNPYGGAAVSAFGGGYYDPNSTYGAGNKIVGTTDIKQPGGGRGGGPGKDENPYDNGSTYSDFWQTYSNQNPGKWAVGRLGAQGMNWSSDTPFGSWMQDQLANAQEAYGAASAQNKQLSFASFLDSLGLGTGPTAQADFWRRRWAAATPTQQGYSASANGAGPTRWSVW